jgi:hypothetical protein
MGGTGGMGGGMFGGIGGGVGFVSFITFGVDVSL